MGYDRGDSFPFDFETNGIPFGSKSKGKLSPRSYPIQFVRKWKYSFLSAVTVPMVTLQSRKSSGTFFDKTSRIAGVASEKNTSFQATKAELIFVFVN